MRSVLISIRPKCYIYCTRPKYEYEDFFVRDYPKPQFFGGGKVIGEFVCDDIFERIVQVGTSCETPKYCLSDWNMDCTPIDGILSDACLTLDELEKYLDGGVGYGWHISDLKIYDTPRELSEFTGLRETRFGAEPVPIMRPPQSWRYVEGDA